MIIGILSNKSIEEYIMKRNRWRVAIYVGGIILATKLFAGDYSKAVEWKNKIIKDIPGSARKETTWFIEEV